MIPAPSRSHLVPVSDRDALVTGLCPGKPTNNITCISYFDQILPIK